MTTRNSGTREPTGGGTVQTDAGEESLTLEIPATIIVSDLAALMDASPVEVIKEFMRNGYMYSINEVVEHDAAVQKRPYGLQDPLVLDALGQPTHQSVMVHAIEEFRQIETDPVGASFLNVLSELFDCLRLGAPYPVAIG